VEGDVSGQVLLRDLVTIPEEVHSGDYVLALAKGIGEKSTIDDYVVTPQLAGDFDRALGLVRSAIETGASRAAYLDGSFGSGKSHFMAVLDAILRGDPAAREKKGLADIVHKHDPWLKRAQRPVRRDPGVRQPRRPPGRARADRRGHRRDHQGRGDRG
jgi:hypothetical protein